MQETSCTGLKVHSLNHLTVWQKQQKSTQEQPFWCNDSINHYKASMSWILGCYSSTKVHDLTYSDLGRLNMAFSESMKSQVVASGPPKFSFNTLLAHISYIFFLV